MENLQSTQGYAVGTTRGTHSGRVHQEWASRPDDEKFLSLKELSDFVHARSDHARTTRTYASSLQVIPNGNDLRLAIGTDEAEFSNWSFGQACNLVSAPTSYLRRLPADLAKLTHSSAHSFVTKTQTAKNTTVAQTDEERFEFLAKQKFSVPDSKRIIEMTLTEEGHKPQSVYDFANGITAVARTYSHQDTRLGYEQAAARIMAKV